MSTERDIAVAVDAGGWKAGAVILYRDWLLEEELNLEMNVESYRRKAALKRKRGKEG